MVDLQLTHSSEGPGVRKKAERKRMFRYRIVIQVLFFLFVFGVTLAGYLKERGVEIPSWMPVCLHGICPFGGVVTLGRYITGGVFIPRTGIGNLFSLAAVAGATLFFGALFCGWLCPLGAVQDWMGKFRRGGRINPKVDRSLGYLRYVVLALVIWTTYRSFNLVFAGFDPFYALFHFWTGTALPLSLAILAGVLILSLFVSRPWCRWLCPLGAVQGLVQKIAPWSIRRDTGLCTSCGACDRACPMGITPSRAAAVADSRCNRCLSCTSSCPVPGALLFRVPKTRFGVSGVVKNPKAVALLVLLSFSIPLLGGAMYRAALGNSAVSADSIAAGYQAALSSSEPGAAFSVDSLSGSMTLKETAAIIGISCVELLDILGLPETISEETLLRDVEEEDMEKTFRWIKEKVNAYVDQHTFDPETAS